MDKQCSSCGGFCGKYCQRENIKQEWDEPVAWISTGPARMIHWTSDEPAYGDDWVALYTKPQTKEWVGLMRGVRAESDFVIIKVNGGNDEARFLCEELINEMTIHKENT